MKFIYSYKYYWLAAAAKLYTNVFRLCKNAAGKILRRCSEISELQTILCKKIWAMIYLMQGG